MSPSLKGVHMIVSDENFKAGIEWWKGWGTGDFNNSEYEAIYSARRDGLTDSWWNATVDRLWNWRAIRSPRPPNTKDAIKERGNERLPMLATQFKSIRTLTSGEPGIKDVEWDDIAELYELSFEVKCCNRRIGSPVFASKMCHFIFPNIFPVMDNFATGVFDYEFYWRGIRDEWLRFPRKIGMINYLQSYIESRNGVGNLHPYETKVLELCQIGYYHSHRTVVAEESTVELRGY